MKATHHLLKRIPKETGRPEPPSRVLLRECVPVAMTEKKDWLCQVAIEL
jgi:hypothetical protein